MQNRCLSERKRETGLIIGKRMGMASSVLTFGCSLVYDVRYEERFTNSIQYSLEIVYGNCQPLNVCHTCFKNDKACSTAPGEIEWTQINLILYNSVTRKPPPSRTVRHVDYRGRNAILQSSKFRQLPLRGLRNTKGMSNTTIRSGFQRTSSRWFTSGEKRCGRTVEFLKNPGRCFRLRTVYDTACESYVRSSSSTMCWFFKK